MIKINFYLIIIPIISLIGGLWQGQYTYDPYHWGFVFSTALDILEGKTPFKEIFLQYGITMPLIHAMTLIIFKKNILSLMLITCLFYSSAIYIIGIVTEKLTLNKFYSFFATFIIFIIYPWPTQPWHNCITFFFTTLFILMFLKEKKIYTIIAGLALATAYLTNTAIWNFIIFFFIIIFSGVFFIYENKIKENFKKKSLILLYSFIIILLLFLIYLISNNLLNIWVVYQKLPFIYNEAIDQVSLYNRVISYLHFLTIYPIKNFINEPQFILFSIFFFANVFFIIKYCILVYKKKYLEININFFIINILIFSLNFQAQLLNLDILATTISLGIIPLMVFISKLKSVDSRIVINFIIIFISIYSLVFSFDLSNSKHSGQRYVHLKDINKNNISYNQKQIKYFKNQKWSKNNWETINTFLKIQKKVKKNCNIDYGANLTSNSLIYALLEYKKIQIIPFFFKETNKVINKHFEPNLIKKIQEQIHNSNILIVIFENNDKLLNLENYAAPEEILIKKKNKTLIEVMYVYYPTKCKSI